MLGAFYLLTYPVQQDMPPPDPPSATGHASQSVPCNDLLIYYSSAEIEVQVEVPHPREPMLGGILCWGLHGLCTQLSTCLALWSHVLTKRILHLETRCQATRLQV